MTGDVGFPIMAGTGKQIIIHDIPIGVEPLFIRLTVLDRQPLDIAALVAQVDSTALKNRLDFIETVRHRTGNPTHLQAVRDSILDHFFVHRWETREQDVPFNAYTGKNLLGNRYGYASGQQTVLVDAHYDTVFGSPGADDNGSGTVGFMEIAEVLSPYPCANTLRFIGFDLEESGLVGSAEYVQKIPSDEEVLGVFNLEMIGYYTEEPNTQELPQGFNLLFPNAYNQVAADSFRGNFITNVGNANSQSLVDLFRQSAQTYVPDLRVIDVVAPGNGSIAPDLLRSDHAPFWVSNRKALMLTDGSEFRYDCYHQPSDLSTKLDFGFMQQVTQVTLAAAAQLADVRHGSWKTVEATTLNASASVLDCSVKTWNNGGGIQLEIKDCVIDTEARFQVFSVDGKMLVELPFSLKNNTELLFEGEFSREMRYIVRIVNEQGRVLWNGKI